MNRKLSKQFLQPKKSGFIIFLIILITIIAFLPLSRLKIRLDPMQLLDRNDPDVVFYDQFKNDFNASGEEQSILIALKNKSGIFQHDFLAKVDSLTGYLLRQPQIIRVYSLTSTALIYFNGRDINARPLIHVSEPEFYKQDSPYLFRSLEYRDLLVSNKGDGIAIGAFNDTLLTRSEKNHLLDSIEAKINKLGFDEAHVLSRIRVEKTALQKLKTTLIICLAFLFIMIVTGFLILRFTVKEILVNLAVIIVTIIWSLALISISKLPLDFYSAGLQLLLIVLTSIYLIYLCSSYRKELNSRAGKQESLEKTLVRSTTIFYLNLVLAFVLFAVSFTRLIYLNDLALVAAFSMVLSNFMVIAILISFYNLENSLQFPGTKSLNHQIKIISSIAIILLTATSIFYINTTNSNPRLADAIPKNSSTWTDLQFIEKNFSGIRPFELVLTMKSNKHNFYEIGLMKKIEEVEMFLRDSLQVGAIISPIALFKGANKAFHGGNIDYFKITDSAEHIQRFAEAIMQTEYADELQRYMVADGSRIRISGRIADIGAVRFSILSEKLQKFIDGNYGQSFSHKLTGTAVIYDKLFPRLSSTLATLLVSLIGTYLLMVMNFWQIRTNKNHPEN